MNVKNAIESTRTFVKEHKPEMVATAIVVGVGVVVGVQHYLHKNCITITKDMTKELSNGDALMFRRRGTRYLATLTEYSAPE